MARVRTQPAGPDDLPLICAKTKCTNGVYQDFVEPTGTAIAKVAANEVVPVTLVRADGSPAVLRT
jgi:hypothetical protein